MLLPDNSGINEAPIDNLKYARKNEDWVEVKDIQTFNNLTDVNIIGIAQNSVPKWDTTTSKWIMGVDGNGIPDVSDTSNYVRSLGQWNLLANTTEISNIVTDIGNLQTDLANLQLTDLTDVSFPTAPVLSDLLKYNTTTTQWEAGTIGVNNLNNVFYTTPSDNQVLQYKVSNPTGTPKWIPSTLSVPTNLDDLSNVVVPSPVLNDILKWDGSNWVNAQPTLPPSGLDDLSDVTLTTPINGQLLTYVGAPTNQWVNSIKPTYTIAEQTDYQASPAPANLDSMVYDSSVNKWKPQSITQETLSYLRIIQSADNISINFTADAGFNKYNLFQTALANHSLVIVGTDISRVNDYTIQINTSGGYHFGISATSEQNNMNFTLV